MTVLGIDLYWVFLCVFSTAAIVVARIWMKNTNFKHTDMNNDT